MNLYKALEAIQSTEQHQSIIPSYLYGAFRRKSINFYNGLTDENTIVYWFQSRSFTIDLRLKYQSQTPITERQGWIGSTYWDKTTELLSWKVSEHANYQNHAQWPEPAKLHAIGNSILEFSPSNVYVEDWRQQVQHGLFLGLRLIHVVDLETQQQLQMDGGLIICADHFAYALTRLPNTQAQVSSLDLASSNLNSHDLNAIENFEVSVGINHQKLYSTGNLFNNESLNLEDFQFLDPQHLIQQIEWYGQKLLLTFKVDMYIPNYTFQNCTKTTPTAQAWFAQENNHLAHHAQQVL